MAIVVFAVAVLLIVFGPGIWVKRTLARYSRPANRYSGSGAELARHLLDKHELRNVAVEETDTGDHYDPQAKAVRLSSENFNGRSLTAITVAAHEVGHALQDASGYAPLRLRTRLVKATRGIEKLGAGILIVAPVAAALTRAPGVAALMFIGGLLTLATATLVHLITLPTEFNASFARALPMLDRHGILKKVDYPHATRILRAAAMTYVAASLMSLLNIARWLAILRR
ncbi:MAG: zinc metallopeptidase [Gammaproteobacteria bacterium]|nr:zinc metallopeptidase [Gammaproteobacteria bacterium]